MILSGAEIARYARGAGITDPAQLNTMVAIAFAESGGDTDAYNPRDRSSDGKWTGSYGLWQVRGLSAQRGTGQYRDPERLTDPAFNARSMVHILRNQGLTAWSVYSNDAYKEHLDRAGEGVAGAGIVGGQVEVVGYASDGSFVGLIGDLFSGSLWRRLGLGALGVVMVAWGAVLLFRDLAVGAAVGATPIGRAAGIVGLAGG